MTVEQLEREFLLGQKWAVEIHRYIEKDGFSIDDEVITNHYTVGLLNGRIKCFKEQIRYIKVVNDEIICVVNQKISESDL